jgi:hypothetical protein
MRHRRAFAALVLVASFGVAGCAADDSGSDRGKAGPAPAEERGVAGPAYDQKPAPPPSSGASGRTAAPPDGTRVSVAPSHVIRTAALSVRVEDPVRGLATARSAAEAAGGHVADESVERESVEGKGEGRMSARIVLRVPQDRFGGVLAELEKGGKLLSRKVDAKDVTDQVVDVQSRIATQRASVARVRELMDRAERLSDVVTLEGELSKRQAELESLLAQQSALKDRTALSTITLELFEPESGAAGAPDDGPGIVDALGGGWDALTSTIRWAGVVLAAVLPFAMVLGGLFALWHRLLRPRIAARRAAAPPAVAAVAPAAVNEPAAAGGLPRYGASREPGAGADPGTEPGGR